MTDKEKIARLIECLEDALIWTEPEYDVGEWRDEAEEVLRECKKEISDG